MNELVRAPCYGCQERTPKCHGKCEKYKEYQKESKKATEIERKARKKY